MMWPTIIEHFHIAYWNLIIGGIGILIMCCLIPVFRMYSSENNPNDVVFESRAFQNAGVAFLTSSCPMLLDVCMDIFCEKHSDKHILFGRLFYVIAAFMVGLQCSLQNDYFRLFSSYEFNFFFQFGVIEWWSPLLPCSLYLFQILL